MEITKELLDAEIVRVQEQHETGSALVNKLAGALSALKDLRGFLDREDPAIAEEAKVEEMKSYISPGNAEAQLRDEERAAAMDEIGKKIGEARQELIADAEEEAMVLDPNYDPIYRGEID